MLRNIARLSPFVSMLVVHSPSEAISFFVRTQLRERYKMHTDFVLDVTTKKEWDNANIDANIKPLWCDRWLINVHTEKLNRKELADGLSTLPAYGVIVLWTDNFRDYKSIKDAKEVQSMGVHFADFSFSRLSPLDTQYLYDTMLADSSFSVSGNILNYVATSYMFDPKTIYDFMVMVKSGKEFVDKRSVIQALGVAGNSVSQLVLKLLRSSFTDEKGRRNALRGLIKALSDLSSSLSHDKIRAYMLSTLTGFIEIKQLTCMGIYNRMGKEIPEGFDEKRIARLRRCDRFLLTEIGMSQLLNAKVCLTRAGGKYGSEMALVQGFADYLASVPCITKQQKDAKNAHFARRRRRA